MSRRKKGLLAQMAQEIEREVGAASELTGWAEDEIRQAMQRYPGQADSVFHAFPLLVPAFSSPAWNTGFVFRSHARELLMRVGTGGNTKRGTAAECCVAMSKVSQAVPLHGAASGFYLRMWELAFPEHVMWDDGALHHEALYSSQIDDLERDVRRKLTIPGRHLKSLVIECDGQHWGQPAECRFNPAG